MLNLKVYKDIKLWKKSVHLSRFYLAKSYLKLLSQLEIVGITGSVGKTLTQNAIASVLSQKYRTVVGNENLDPTFRIPNTILKAKKWDKFLVLEYGVEHPGDMDHYLSLVKPKIAVVTTISPTHLKYLKSVQGVYDQKVKLVESLHKNGHAVLNADDPEVVKMASQTTARIWWYGNKARNGVKISHFGENLKGANFRLHYKGQKATVNWKVFGEHQLLSAYAAATVGIVAGLTLKQIAKGLSATRPPEHRLNLITTKDANIIDDTYNASPVAAERSIATLRSLGNSKQKIAVLGQMRDLGHESQELHNELGKQIAKSKINQLITVGKTASTIAKAALKNGFGGKIIVTSNTKEALKSLQNSANPKNIILVKGSRHDHLERIVYGLLGKSTEINCYHCGKLN